MLVSWFAPFLAGGGYSSEAISFALELSRWIPDFGIVQFAEHADGEFLRGLPDHERGTLQSLQKRGRANRKLFDSAEAGIAICHSTPDVWLHDGAFGWGAVEPCPPTGDKVFAVGRTMYETDRVPASWVERINSMDEVWVPSEFHVKTFTRSGVRRELLWVVPEAVDTDFFDPLRPTPSLPSSLLDGIVGPPRTVFLSIFKWEARKGWDVLLRAFFAEFDSQSHVVLVIKTSAFHSTSEFNAEIRRFAKEKLGLSTDAQFGALPSVRVLGEHLSLAQLPALYRTADCFVLPSRGEGWGRPHVEAMAMGLPVIATDWSGSTAFLDERYSLPIRIEGLVQVDQLRDEDPPHFWADPSVSHLRERMRWVVDNPADAAALGARAREHMVERYSPSVVGRAVRSRLKDIEFRMRGRDEL